ncbi:hypothetical protein BDZ94DRAFT_1272250 [Collybia nuda]|uniref:Uncharacterized protein n=1 Tax=Collybia nuda TaxID=64659 RepID=A0A9P5XUE3_9AGAR|nr:hypothetical protein BDZ94DRAFT_1272250 [Collybia nuda]
MSPEVSLGPGALPNLRHLTADMFNVTLLALGNVLSLKTLESLSTGGVGGRGSTGALADMGSALEMLGGLPGLTTLKLELNDIEDETGTAHWVERLGQLCPAVEHFWGDMYVEWAAIEHQNIFASYKNLKQQILPDSDPSVTPMRARVDGIQDFMAHNSSRDAKGAITSIVDRLGGQPVCIKAFPRIMCCPM